MKKIEYDFAINKLNSYGHKLLSEYINTSIKIKTIDKDGYLYYFSLDKLNNNYHPPKFHKCNPFSIQNLLLFTKRHCSYLTLLDKEYFSSNYYLTFKDKDGYLYTIIAFKFTYGYIPLKFFKKNIYTIYNINLFLKINKRNIILKDGKYIGCERKMNWQCLNSFCKQTFDMCWSNIKTGQGCPYCAGRRTSQQNCVFNFPEIIKDWDYDKNTISPNEVYIGSHCLVWWKCNKCNFSWEKLVYKKNTSIYNCPVCAKKRSESKMATEIKNYYKEKYNNKTKLEYRILRNPRTNCLLSFDIFIEHIKLFIEINGKQHYSFDQSNRYYANFEQFEYQQYKDNLKKEFAINNGHYIDVDLRYIDTFEDAITKINNYITFITTKG